MFGGFDVLVYLALVFVGSCGCAWFVFSTSRIPRYFTFSHLVKTARLTLNFVYISFYMIFSGAVFWLFEDVAQAVHQLLPRFSPS